MTTDSDKPGPKAGGALIALSILAGAGIGVALGQPSIGVVGGTTVGVAIAILIWIKDRKDA